MPGLDCLTFRMRQTPRSAFWSLAAHACWLLRLERATDWCVGRAVRALRIEGT